MKTVFFWILWGAISFWALKTFYYSFSKEKLERLRKSALGINLAILLLTFLPWLPVPPAGGPLTLGGNSGLVIALNGNILALLFIILLIASIVLFLTKDALLLKIGSVITIINTFMLFVIMYNLRPETFVLTLFDIAPIITVMLLLVNDAALLLLWQQLQLKEKGKKR